MKTRHKIIGAVCTIIVILTSTIIWMEYGVVCNAAVLEHLHKYSNLFDEDFDGRFIILDIGLPFGVTEIGIQECVDHVLRKNAIVED